MSGVNLKRVRDGSMSVTLKASANLDNTSDDANNHVGGFSYLFNTASSRKTVREAKQQEEREARRKRKDDVSKHQKALVEAHERGLKLEGMTRKEKREFLHLTKSKQQEEAARAAKEFKLHELMDEKLAWYQQGPHPIDLISEKLVRRKAEKRGKQMGLKYNYLLPHPSWIARRAQHRREGLLVALGRRIVFDDISGQAMDPLHNVPVDVTKINLLLCDATPAAASGEDRDANASRGIGDEGGKASAKNLLEADRNDAAACAALSRRLLADVIVDPRQSQNSYVRAVVKNREAAQAIKQANLSTNFMSSSLVQGPSIGNEDDPAPATSVGLRPRASRVTQKTAGTRTAATLRAVRDEETGRPKRPVNSKASQRLS